jgi:hypothetical protein
MLGTPGVHAGGAVAALALGCAMLLHDQWLTLAIALFLPALAWVEAHADLLPLRHVALAVAALVLVRLLLSWYVFDYAFGTTPIANGLVAAYAAPAAAFALAAAMFPAEPTTCWLPRWRPALLPSWPASSRWKPATGSAKASFATRSASPKPPCIC